MRYQVTIPPLAVVILGASTLILVSEGVEWGGTTAIRSCRGMGGLLRHPSLPRIVGQENKGGGL